MSCNARVRQRSGPRSSAGESVGIAGDLKPARPLRPRRARTALGERNSCGGPDFLAVNWRTRRKPLPHGCLWPTLHNSLRKQGDLQALYTFYLRALQRLGHETLAHHDQRMPAPSLALVVVSGLGTALTRGWTAALLVSRGPARAAHALRPAPSPSGERVLARVELSTRAIGSVTRSSGTPQRQGLDELQRA